MLPSVASTIKRLLLMGLGLSAVASAAPMVIIHGDFDPTLEPKNAYKTELYQLLLDATRAEYGDYVIKNNTSSIGYAKRLANMISQGDNLNLLWASPGTPIANAQVIPIPVDIMRGLMGYRVCLTTAASQQKLLSINSLGQLQAETHILQGAGWADNEIYAHNDIKIATSENFDGLFPMIVSGRYHCLALGADEIRSILGVRQAKFPQLMIEKRLLIYYEYPIYLYVSAKHPEIADRLSKGFKIIKANGAFDKLFESHYKDELTMLDVQHRHTICIKSPFLPAAQQCQPSSNITPGDTLPNSLPPASP